MFIFKSLKVSFEIIDMSSTRGDLGFTYFYENYLFYPEQVGQK